MIYIFSRTSLVRFLLNLLIMILRHKEFSWGHTVIPKLGLTPTNVASFDVGRKAKGSRRQAASQDQGEQIRDWKQDIGRYKSLYNKKKNH